MAALILFVPTAYGAIYTYDVTTPVTDGVTLRQIKKFFGDSWLNVTVVRADLTDPHISLSLLKGAGADSLTSMAALTDGREDVLAATNADFFDNTQPQYSQGFSLGVEIQDGTLLQSQISEDMAAAFYDGERLVFDYMTMSITITAPNGETHQVKHLNKHTDYYGELLMYTSDWNNGFSPAPGGEVVEVVVEDNKITEFRRGQPSVIIPKNGYVLVVSEGSDMFLANNFAVGDTVTLDITSVPDFDGIATAFGGGTMLLKDGAKTRITHQVSGLQPRTCIGASGDGSAVYLITVDGRQYASKGATLDELADIALEVGCTDALNLDGGGSTRMLGRTFWDDELKVLNLPTENRKVINAAAITTDAPAGEAVGVEIRTQTQAIIVGDSVTVESRLKDANGTATMQADGEIQWGLEGVDGDITGGVFRPVSAGTAKITAEYKGHISDPVYISVSDRASSIALPQEISLERGQTYILSPSVHDQDFDAWVSDISLLSPSLTGTGAELNGNTVTAVADGYSVLEVKFGGASSYMLIRSGVPEGQAPSVPANVYSDSSAGKLLDASSFSVFAYTAQPNTLFQNMLYRRGIKSISGSDSYGFLGTYDPDRLPTGLRTPICANNYSAYNKGFALIISLPSSGKLSGDNWKSMAQTIEASNPNNIIILSDVQPSGRVDNDTEVFYDYFEKLTSDKNIFIVTPGRDSSAYTNGGIHYITLRDASRYTGITNAMDSAQMLTFTVNGSSCMYSFENIF